MTTRHVPRQDQKVQDQKVQHQKVQHQKLLNKVPEVTIYFWVIKVLCTTVGESAADFLNVNLNFGLSGTSIVTGILLVVALAFQFSANQYIPGVYWLSVALVSVFGTLVTDNLTDALGTPLEASTLVFSALLAVTFLAWYRTEHTLSIHTIVTRRREGFYWCAVLFTFALGTAAGDLMAEVLGLGYLVTGVIVTSLITLTAVAWRAGLNPVLSFWIIYILTRPLGASIGDYLAQPPSQSGLGLGATMTSLVFVAAILVTVTYLSVTRADVISNSFAFEAETEAGRGGLWQTVLVVAMVLIASGTGYAMRKSALQENAEATVPAASSATAAPGPAPTRMLPGAARPARTSPLGDLSTFRTITQDTLGKLNAGDQSAATARVDDLETEWDNAEARLKPKNKAAWTDIDRKIDTVLRELRSTSPVPTREKTALSALLAALGQP